MATIPKKTLRWANEEGESLEKVKEFSKTNLVELPPPLTDTKEAIDKEISKLPWTNSSDIEASLEIANNSVTSSGFSELFIIIVMQFVAAFCSHHA